MKENPINGEYIEKDVKRAAMPPDLFLKIADSRRECRQIVDGSVDGLLRFAILTDSFSSWSCVAHLCTNRGNIQHEERVSKDLSAGDLMPTIYS